MNKTIELEARSNYGTTNYYVVSEHKEHIRRLTGNKTIHYPEVLALEALGFEVVIRGVTKTVKASEAMLARR